MVVDHLVEQSLPTPEVRGLNSVISKLFIEHLLTVKFIEKTKIKKRPGMVQFLTIPYITIFQILVFKQAILYHLLVGCEKDNRTYYHQSNKSNKNLYLNCEDYN